MATIQERVLDVLQDNPGIHMTASRVEDLANGLSRTQVVQGLYVLSKKGLAKRVDTGIYTYLGAHTAKPADGIYETAGQLQDGTTIVRSEDGELFVLESIEAHFGRSL